MKSFVLLFLVFISAIVYGQTTKDTIYVYQGDTSKLKIEYDINGLKTKETFYSYDNQIEQESFFDKGEQMHWIAYDSLGNKTSEWINPEIENVKHRTKRNVALIISIIIVTILLSVIWRYYGYESSYYSLIAFTIVIPSIALIVKNQIDRDHYFQWILWSSFIITPIFVFVLSIVNFFIKTKIPLWISILFGLISALFLLFIIFLINISGSGMIG
ncbi:hypothetical protein [Sporocytophaga myxococcoides]|uniref:hypothetical protein n=1 Tax=Sporocytophaga myxococcoides TaxID=153721 RepID=UPI000424E29B|nr:hypothetical protein [Sporocytophaga myxococcoides]